MGSHHTTSRCTTCGRPAFPHPYRHPITLQAPPPKTAAQKANDAGAVTPAPVLSDREKLALLASELVVARLDIDTERQRADRWREDGGKFYDLREWLRLCDDTPEGHAEFYRWAAHIIFPDTYPAPGDDEDEDEAAATVPAPTPTPEQRVADAEAAVAAAQAQARDAQRALYDAQELAAFSKGAQ